MSEALYELGGLRFWNENEIELREAFTSRVIFVVRSSLLSMNSAWNFARMEGPCLSPRDKINEAYGDSDVFLTNHLAGGLPLCLRAETTASSYAYARRHMKKPPFCVYQAGKSFRREMNDGASASKMRFNEFWQLEFQCIYADSTMADYRSVLIPKVAAEIKRFTQRETRFVESDRLPVYSLSTIDIEAQENPEFWREMASCSIRNDYAGGMKVCEIAIGLDRVATLAAGVDKTNEKAT